MAQEKNPYEKHMKSTKGKFVATFPNGHVVRASTETNFRKLQAEYRNEHPEFRNRDDDPVSKKVEKPQFDPNTGERLN